MEKVKCPNPKCGRRIFDIEEMPPGKVVLEMKCCAGVEWQGNNAPFPVGAGELLQQPDPENAGLGLRWCLCG